jgi:hypothetical protein
MSAREVVTQYQTATAFNPSSSATVGTTSTVIIPINAIRFITWITNTSSTATVYLSLGGTAVVGKGIVLAPGATWTTNVYNGPVSAIASAAATNVAIAEV